MALLYNAFRFQHNRLILRHEVEVKEVESRKLREVNEIKSRFFANISHEFRTPLTLILGPIHKWQERVQEEGLKKDLSMAERNAHRLLRLINQLLDLSKLEVGGMKLHARCMNIVPLIKGITYSFESSAGIRGITLKTSVEREEIQVYCDEDVIEKVLTNLLSNAMKFTPKGGSVEVTVKRVTGRGEFVEIGVSDTGIGIPETHLAHIFDRFYQVDDSATREQGGTGIGLALVKELVELHHGTTSATSRPGLGTSFTIALPLGKEHLKPEEIVAGPEVGEEVVAKIIPEGREVGQESSRPLDQNQGKHLILVVEDNADVREYIKDNLSDNYCVLEASDGLEGIEKARETVPDLVLSDVMMPKKDGYELCRTLKSDERTSHIPVILLTAKAASENKLEGLETGADDYLIKPFEPKELQVRIKNLIELRRKLRERFKTSVPLKPGEVAVTSMDDVFLKRVIVAVEQHMGEEHFHTDDLAREVGLSRVQLHRKLTALTNQPPGDFIRYLRLHRAMELIEKNAGTISEIAYVVGFNDPSYFSKCFHKQFGKAPVEVKKAHEGGIFDS
jgi:DNA-binding response OmpR family regulator/nitrogen-specific signal transduction histidine kinase